MLLLYFPPIKGSFMLLVKENRYRNAAAVFPFPLKALYSTFMLSDACDL